jgi:hypothetical protein
MEQHIHPIGLVKIAEMNLIERRQRLDDLNSILDGRTPLPKATYVAFLHEALELCDNLGLDRAWRRFKALLEREQREEVQARSASAGRNTPMTEQEKLFATMHGILLHLHHTHNWQGEEALNDGVGALEAFYGYAEEEGYEGIRDRFSLVEDGYQQFIVYWNTLHNVH